MPSSRARWAVVAAIFVGSTLFCLDRYEIPSTARFGLDTWEYQSIAVNFGSGHGLKSGGILPFDEYRFAEKIDKGYEPTLHWFLKAGGRGGEFHFYRQPGYPFVLGALSAVVGVRPEIAMLIQMLVIICIGAILPVLGEHLLGPRGFAAGIPAGIAATIFLAPRAIAIVTEPLIALACFAILATWIHLVRRNDFLSEFTAERTHSGYRLRKNL